MGPRVKSSRGMERWLDGGAPTGDAAIAARRLDEAFRADPGEVVWREAERRLRRSLQLDVPPVHYDVIRSSPFGPLWVAVSERGLVAVSFGGRETGFAAEVARRTGRPTVRSSRRTAGARREIQTYLEGRRKDFSVEVDLRHVTPFQREVLAAARAIPRGQVMTYGQIARRIGRPRAARAIGQALGDNPIPIVVPCHRVLASDGSLGGYSGRGGIRTKLRLLRLEGAALLS